MDTCEVLLGNLYIVINVGGIIEDNEVFGNRYHGICLATGVNPKLKGEH